MSIKRVCQNTITRTAFTIICLGMSLSLFATKVKGRVKNDEGEIVSFASILIKDTNKGTSANEDGYYFIELPEGKTTFTVRMIGYKTLTKTIQISGAEMTLNFQLFLEGTELDEVVVVANAEDPAYGVMRKVIANKSKNGKKLQSLETDIYLKGKMYIRSFPKKILGTEITDSAKAILQQQLGLDSSNAGIIYLLEQFTKYYYKAPNKEYSKVNAVKTSGDPRGLGFATMPAIVDVYDNNVEIMSGVGPRGFISPAHNNAFQYYKYKLLSYYEEDGTFINKISFWPKRSNEPTFRGTLYVVDNDWTFQQLELVLDKNAQVDVVDTLILRQQFRKTKEQTWMIQQQVIYPVINLFGFEIAGDFLTNYTNAIINEKIPDSIFKSRVISSYDSTALSQNDSFWKESRPVRLSEEEGKNYTFQDSVYQKNAAKKDSLYNATIRNYNPMSIIVTGPFYKKRNNQIGIEPLLTSSQFNTVEGFIVGLHPYWKHGLGKGDSFNVTWRNHYGFANKQFQSMLSFSYLNIDSSFIGRKTLLWGNVGRDVFQINSHNPSIPLLNTYASLFYGTNYMKLYQSAKVQLGIKHDFGNGFGFHADVDFEDRVRMENHSNYSFVNRLKLQYTVNQPSELPAFENHRAAIVSIGIKYQPGWKFIQYPDYKSGIAGNAPVFELNYKKGIANILDSKSDFDRWQFLIQHSVKMKLAGLFAYRLEAGGFLNSKYVGNPDMYHLYGNYAPFANPYLKSFQTAPFFTYSSVPKQYGQAHMEWHLNGFLTDKIPGFKKLNWHLVFSGNGMYVDPTNYFGEYGIGFENIGYKLFRFIRVDFVAGKGSENQTWRLGYKIGTNIPLDAFMK